MGKPRNVRNFWIELDVDGRETEIATGPVAKDGGFSMSILIRENGKISKKKISITGFAENSILKVLIAKYTVGAERNTEYLTLESER